MSKSDTWMPLYIGDYLGATGHLRTVEHGAYMLLLIHYWRNGPLPDDDAKLAAIARMTRREWADVAPTLRGFFRAEAGMMHQRRADAERAKTIQLSNKRRAVADARWGANRAQEASNCSAIASPIAVQTASNCSAIAYPIAEQLHTHAGVASQSQSQEPKEEGRKAETPSASARAKPDPRGCRLPEGWRPSDGDREFALGLGINPDAVAEEFADYWRGVPGVRGRKLDWSGTYRNRCRETADRHRPAPGRAAKPNAMDEKLRSMGLMPGRELFGTIDGEAA